MKSKVLDTKGNEKGEIGLPESFSRSIRKDIISRVIESRRSEQPYAPSPIAGRQHAAKGKIVHRRQVWRSQYGRGISRVPRKILSQRGSQFNWEAAEVPNARGGMRAHPPKVSSLLKRKKINKKELKIAFESALSATANPKQVAKKYSSIEEKNLGSLPLIIDSQITKMKTKDLLNSLKNLLGEDIFNIAIKDKSIRPGKGKKRGRKYKKTGGMLMVTGNEEKLKTTAFDSTPVKNLDVNDLASEGPGRLTVYTEQAIKDLVKKSTESKE